MFNCPPQFGMSQCPTTLWLLHVQHSSACRNAPISECWCQPNNTKSFTNTKFIPQFICSSFLLVLVPPYPLRYYSGSITNSIFLSEGSFDRNNVYNLFHWYHTLRNICVFYKVNTRTTTETVSFLQSSSDHSYAYLKFMSEGLDSNIFLVPIFGVCYSCYPVNFAKKLVSNMCSHNLTHMNACYGRVWGF